MHHAQAIEMTDLIESHTENKDIRLLGARISHSQSDEIKFMKRWLTTRGEEVSLPMADMPGMCDGYVEGCIRPFDAYAGDAYAKADGGS